MRATLAVCMVLLLAAIVSAQAPQPFVRAHSDPADHVVVGQPVRVIVEVLVPNYFMGGTDFPEIEIKNAIVVAPQETPQNFSEQLNGQAFAGIRQIYTVYPEVPGDFRLPPAPVGVKYADAPPHSVQSTVPLPTLSFHASIPEAAAGLSDFLPTTKATLTQKWTPSLKSVQTGETIERTITITTEKLQGMLIPPVALDAPDGIRIYTEQPVVQDEKSDRGDFIGGRRVETAKYLIQKPGDYILPEVRLQWWDLASNRVRTGTLPAVHFAAVADVNYSPELPPTLEPEAAPQPLPPNPWRRLWLFARASWIWILCGALLLWASARWIPTLIHWLGGRREELRASEPAYFRKLTASCQRNDAQGAYVSLLRWIERSRPGASIERYLRETNASPDLRRLVDELGAHLYSPAPKTTWNGTALAKALRAHRGQLHARTQKKYALPPLNPTSEAANPERQEHFVVTGAP